MKANKNWMSLAIAIVVTTIAAFSAGYLIANFSHSQSNVPLVSEQSDRSLQTRTDTKSVPGRSESIDALNDVSDLENLARFNSHYDRTVALTELLRNATMDLLQAHLEQSQTIGSASLREAVQIAIVQRMATRNPKAALGKTGEFSIELRQQLVQAVFQEWSLADLEEAIEFARSLDSSIRLEAVEGILLSVESMTLADRRAIARRLGNEWLAIETIENEFGTELFEDPEREWHAFLNRNKDYMQSLNLAQSKMLVHIASAWIERDGVDVWERIRESFPTQHPLQETISSVVNEILKRNPQVALEMAANVEGIGSRLRADLTGEVLTRWAEFAPESAFKAVDLIEARYLRRQLQAQVLETWASTDAQSLLRLIESLPLDMQVVAREKVIGAIARTSPRDAAEMLNDIVDQHSRKRVAETVAISWAKQDVFGALDWIEGDLRIDTAQEHLTKMVFRELARTDPQLAFQTALGYPTDADGKGMEVFVIETLAFGGDLDKAISLLPFTRKGVTRNSAYENIIYSLLIEDDTMRANDAMGLFIDATKTDSVENIGFMLMNLSWRAPVLLFNSLDELPSKELRQEAAESLLVHNEDNGVFSDDQLAEIRGRNQRATDPNPN